jgi:hypothetical protein
MARTLPIFSMYLAPLIQHPGNNSTVNPGVNRLSRQTSFASSGRTHHPSTLESKKLSRAAEKAVKREKSLIHQ